MSLNHDEDNEEYEETIFGILLAKCPELCRKFQAELDALNPQERERLEEEVLALAEIVDEKQQAFFADLKHSAVRFKITNNAGDHVIVDGCNFAEQ